MIKYFITPAFWFALSMVCLILEILTPGFFLGTFAIASLVTSVGAFFTKDFNILIGIFAVASLVAYVLVRPIYLEYLHKYNIEKKFGFSSLVGKTGLVSLTVTSQEAGYIKIDGDQWRALLEADTGVSLIEAGQQAKIVRVEGNSVYVTACS